MSLDETIRSAILRAAGVRVRNALNPLLWACAVVSPVFFGAAYAFRDDPLLRYFLSGTGSLPVFATLIAYFFFMLRDPDRLQSEEFVIRQHELSMLEIKGQLPSEPGRSADSEDLSTPTQSQIGHGP